MHRWLRLLYGVVLGATGTLGGLAAEQIPRVTPAIDAQGTMAATVEGVPLIKAVHVRHAAIPRENWGKVVVSNKRGALFGKVTGPGNASAEWSADIEDGDLHITITFDGEQDKDGRYPTMDARVVLAPDLFRERKYALWGEAVHEPSGVRAPCSSTGEYPPLEKEVQQIRFTPIPYGSSVKQAEFYGEEDIIEIRAVPRGTCSPEEDGWSIRSGPGQPGSVRFVIGIRKYGALAKKIAARPGVVLRDPTTPPTPNLSRSDNGFEQPFSKTVASGSLPSGQWGLSLHGNSEAFVERTARDARSGEASLRLVKNNQLGHVQLWHIRGVAKTPAAERDGVKYLLRYWGRVRGTGVLKGGVFIYAVEGQGRGQRYGPPLTFDLPTGPTDMTPWTRKDYIYTLKKGEYIDRAIFTFTGHTGDEAQIDDLALYRLPENFEILDEIDVVRSQWPVVPQGAIPYLPDSIRRPESAGNLLQNGSFEAGADRLARGGYYSWYRANQYQIDRSTAHHGSSSLRLQQGVGRNCRTKVYRATPGKLHTFSFHAKADRSGMSAYAQLLSGLQADHSGERIGWIARPGVRRTFPLSENWEHFCVSFIPVTRLLPTLYVQIAPKGDKDGVVWIDALALEQGPETEFATDTRLQVSAKVDLPAPGRLDCTAFTGWIETHRTRLPPGEKWELEMPPIFIFDPADRVPLASTVYTDQPREVELRWEFVDYYGRIARRLEHRVETGESCVAEIRFGLKGFDLGRYVIRLKASSKGCRPAAAEETSFTVLPRALDDPSFQTDFGFTCWVPSWVYWHRRLGFHAIRSLDSMTLWPYTWGRCETARGRYEFHDGTYNWLKERGVETMVCLAANLGPDYAYGRNVPEWAKADRKAFPAGTPQNSFGFDPEQYLKFVTALAEHWRGRIKLYEVWNEPYGQNDSARPTGELGRKVAEAIRKADPHARIYAPCAHWGSGTSKWTETAMSYLKTDTIDGFSYHGYPTRLHEEESWGWTAALGRFNKVLEANGGRRPMMDTEMQASKSWLWTDRLPGTGNLTYLPKPAARDQDTFWPKVVGQYYIVARAMGTHFFWTYQAWEPGYGTHDDLTPGNALLATAVNGWLMGASKFLEEVDLGERLRCYLFETRDKRLLAAGFGMYLEEPGTVSWPLPEGTEVYGVLGTQLWPSQDEEPLARREGQGIVVQLSRDPFYVLAPTDLTREVFVEALGAAEITGIALMRSHPFVINLPDGRPGLAVAIQNLSPNRDLEATVSAQSPERSGWRFEGDARSGVIPKRSEAVLRLPLAGMPRRAEGIAQARIRTKVEGERGPTESTIRLLGVAKAPQDMAIDGDLKEWRGIQASISLDRKDQINDQKAGTRWHGPKDLSMSMRLVWDTENLYVAAEVQDDKFVMDRKEKTSPLAYWFAADCVEVFLDTSNAATVDRRTATDNKYHLYFIAGRGESRVADWMCELSDPPLTDVRVASRFTPAGYVIEAAIPLSCFPAIKQGKPGTVVRFFAAVNDRDTPGGTHSPRKTGMLWYQTDRWWENSLDYTSLVFLPRGSDE